MRKLLVIFALVIASMASAFCQTPTNFGIYDKNSMFVMADKHGFYDGYRADLDNGVYFMTQYYDDMESETKRIIVADGVCHFKESTIVVYSLIGKVVYTATMSNPMTDDEKIEWFVKEHGGEMNTGIYFLNEFESQQRFVIR